MSEPAHSKTSPILKTSILIGVTVLIAIGYGVMKASPEKPTADSSQKVVRPTAAKEPSTQEISKQRILAIVSIVKQDPKQLSSNLKNEFKGLLEKATGNDKAKIETLKFNLATGHKSYAQAMIADAILSFENKKYIKSELRSSWETKMIASNPQFKTEVEINDRFVKDVAAGLPVDMLGSQSVATKKDLQDLGAKATEAFTAVEGLFE